ncbi:MAG: hypothetical protein M0Z61_03145 [Nitrospiraceae bacterium]|nr:hypothetical protein [Nitrospiraceae bacterium]
MFFNNLLNTEQGSRLFRSFVEVNPEICTETLNREFGKLSIEELLKVGPGRRNLVWSLEKLCFWANTFPLASKTLLLFAAAENETWGNNATNQFLQLFHIFLPGTQAVLADRIKIIRLALSSKIKEIRAIGVKALGSALNTYHFSRTGGVEEQGSRAPQKDARPKTWAEIFEYWAVCLDLLTDIICSKDKLEELARKQIADNIHGLLTHGQTSKIEEIINLITEKNPKYWPNAISNIKLTLKYDQTAMPSEVKLKIESILGKLSPISLTDKIKDIITSPAWEHSQGEGGHYIDVSAVRARQFADELVSSKIDFDDYLPQILVGDQRQAYTFGQRLGELIKNKKEFVEYVLNRLRAVDNDGNPMVLAGFLSTSNEKPLIEKTLDTIADDKKLYVYLVDITRLIKPEEIDLKRVLSLFKKGLIQAQTLNMFIYGSVLDHLSYASIENFCRQIMGHGAGGLWVALNIAFMYSFQTKERWDSLRFLFRELLFKTDILLGQKASIMDAYNWEESCKKLLTNYGKDEELAIEITKGILKAANKEDFEKYLFDFHAKPVLRVLLTNYLENVWPLLGEAFLSEDYLLIFNLEVLIGSRFEIAEEKKGPLFTVHKDFILKWCEDNYPKAPRIIAELMPLYIKDEETGKTVWHPLAKNILDKFGQDENILKAISANMGSFSWTGSLVPYYQMQLELMEALREHTIDQVREWALKGISLYKEQIKQESARDAERDFGIL